MSRDALAQTQDSVPSHAIGSRWLQRASSDCSDTRRLGVLQQIFHGSNNENMLHHWTRTHSHTHTHSYTHICIMCTRTKRDKQRQTDTMQIRNHAQMSEHIHIVSIHAHMHTCTHAHMHSCTHVGGSSCCCCAFRTCRGLRLDMHRSALQRLTLYLLLKCWQSFACLPETGQKNAVLSLG